MNLNRGIYFHFFNGHPYSSLPTFPQGEDALLTRVNAWIISGPRLVQTQDALNVAVYVILRIQGSEVFVLRSGRP